MKTKIIVLGCLLFSLAGFSQASKPYRYISYVDLNEPENSSFNYYDISLTRIVFRSIEAGAITLYKFKSFDQSPKVLSLIDFKKSLTIPGINFPVWNSGTQYRESDRVAYLGQNYECMYENKGSQPDTSPDVWIPTQIGKPMEKSYSDFSMLGLDYLASPGNPAKLQFIHFYYSQFPENREYHFSVDAKTVVDLLNKSNYLLYTKLGYMNHLVGDVFLLNEFDEKISMDLKQKIDTAKTKVADDRYNILVQYNKNRIEQFFLYEQGSELMDTVPRFDLKHMASEHQCNFGWLGDALLDAENLKFVDGQKETRYKVLKEGPQPAKLSELPITTLECRTSELFYLNKKFHKKIYEAKFFSTLNQFLNIVYQGVSDSKLVVYNGHSLNEKLTFNEILYRWTKEQHNTYPEWVQDAYYYKADHIMVNGVEYISLIDNNSNLFPTEHPAAWSGRKISVSLFQPADITMFDISYKLTFDSSGVILNKQPQSIQIFAFREDAQVFAPLATFDYRELFNYASNQNPEMKQFLKKWIETQTGLFSVRESGPLKGVSNEKK